MNYREQLNAFRELERLKNLSLLDIEVANEVDAVLNDLNEKDFETMCNIVSRAYLKADSGTSIYMIIIAVQRLLEEKSLIDIAMMSSWDILEEVDY